MRLHGKTGGIRLILVLAVALIVFESQPLAGITRLLGLAVAELFRVSRELTGIIRTEVEAAGSEKAAPPQENAVPGEGAWGGRLVSASGRQSSYFQPALLVTPARMATSLWPRTGIACAWSPGMCCGASSAC